MKKYIFILWTIGISIGYAQNVIKDSDKDWQSDSFIQTFVDLEAEGKQVHEYEDRLNIKPYAVETNSITNIKTLNYRVKNCALSVYTDKDGNVAGYTIKIDKKCPFKVPDPLNFDSKSSSLKNILSIGKGNCHHYTFNTMFFNSQQCGQVCDFNANEMISEPFARMCAIKYERVSFVFDSNTGIEKWRDQIVELNSSKNPYRIRDLEITKRFKNGEYDSLAQKLWGDELPKYLTIYFYNYRFPLSEDRRRLYGE